MLITKWKYFLITCLWNLDCNCQADLKKTQVLQGSFWEWQCLDVWKRASPGWTPPFRIFLFMLHGWVGCCSLMCSVPIVLPSCPLPPISTSALLCPSAMLPLIVLPHCLNLCALRQPFFVLFYSSTLCLENSFGKAWCWEAQSLCLPNMGYINPVIQLSSDKQVLFCQNNTSDSKIMTRLAVGLEFLQRIFVLPFRN